MGNKNKAKGTRAETSVVKFLASEGIQAKRKALTGSKDCGDIEVIGLAGLPVCILEVKAGKQTENPNRSQMTDWLMQAATEEANSGLPCILVVVRYRRAIKDADVLFKWHGMYARLYLDQFCSFFKEQLG